MSSAEPARVKISVVGVGGAGGNAILRMARSRLQGVELLAVNTDVQALGQIKGVRTFAIGPRTTGGMGSGGRPDVGRKAIKESQEQITQLMEGMDMVFVTAGMGGGTGTGACGAPGPAPWQAAAAPAWGRHANLSADSSGSASAHASPLRLHLGGTRPVPWWAAFVGKSGDEANPAPSSPAARP